MKLNSIYDTIKFNGVYLLVDIKNDIYYKIDEELFGIIENAESINSSQNIAGVAFLKSKGILIDNESVKEIPKANSRKKNFFSITRIKLLSFRVNRILTRFIDFTHIDSFKHWGKLFVCVGSLGLLLSTICIALSVGAIQKGTIIVNIKDIVESIPYVYVSLFLISCLHEFGHALMCKLHCGFVGKCGIMLFFLTPAFFTNTTISRFAQKKERAQIISAGVVFQCFISNILSVILIIGLKWNNPVWTTLYLVFWFNLITIVLNINPLFKYDGYWMLSLMLDDDFLYEKSIIAVKNTILGKRSSVCSNAKLTAYGIAVILFYLIMWVGSFIAIYYVLFPVIGWFCLSVIAVVIIMVVREIHGWGIIKI